MAITKLMHMKESSKGAKSSHLKNAIEYILQEHKVAKEDGIKYAASQGCILKSAYQEMLSTKKHYGKTDGRQGYHFVISFAPDDNVTKEKLWKIVQGFVSEYLQGYEAVYAIHDDADHLHAHIIFNSVNYKTGYKYHYKNGDWERNIQPLVDRLCIENNAPVLKYHIDEYEESGEKKEIYTYSKKINWTSEIKQDIEECIAQSSNWLDFCLKMKEIGYRFNFGKSLSIRKPGMGKARRLKENTVGFEYTPDGIIERINFRNGRSRLNAETPVIREVKSSPDDIKTVSKKYKRYKDMSFMEKVLVRHMLRIKRVIPEYKIYPGSFMADRKGNELQKAAQELLIIKQYNIHSAEELDKLYYHLTNQEKEIRKGDKIMDLKMKEIEKGREENTGNEAHQDLEVKEFIAGYDKNKSKSEELLKNLKKQKRAVSRLIKKYYNSESALSKDNRQNRRKKSRITNMSKDERMEYRKRKER